MCVRGCVCLCVFVVRVCVCLMGCVGSEGMCVFIDGMCVCMYGRGVCVCVVRICVCCTGVCVCVCMCDEGARKYEMKGSYFLILRKSL